MTVAFPSPTAEQARALTDRIKVAIEGTWHLITEAYTSRAWASLGYSSGDDYCTREFGTSRLRLPREERSEVVGSMRDAGLSNRAIAAATGEPRETVRRVIASGDPFGSPDPGRHSLVDVAEEFGVNLYDEPALTEEECEALDEQRTIGTDGKSYPKPVPRAPARRSLPDAFFGAVTDLGKIVERVERLTGDDRFARNAQSIAHYRSNLIRSVNSLQATIDRLPH